jgi:hypothetical protein
LSKLQRKKLEKKIKEESRLAEEENARVAKAIEEAVYDFDLPEALLLSAPPAPKPEPKPKPELECVFDNPPPAEPIPVVVED